MACYGKLGEVYEYYTDLHEIHEHVVGVDMSGEIQEQELIFRHLDSDAKVLEFGGNVGRSSLVISKILKDPSQHVVLESDPEIAAELEANRDKNHCHFHIVAAALSETPLIQNFWSTKTHDVTKPIPPKWKSVPTITYSQLLRRHPINFNTLVADCEGCLGPIFKSYPQILDNIQTIIIENDALMVDVELHNFIKSFIMKHGFRSVECRDLEILDRHKCFFEVWKR